jgi:hypothetical protein
VCDLVLTCSAPSARSHGPLSLSDTSPVILPAPACPCLALLLLLLLLQPRVQCGASHQCSRLPAQGGACGAHRIPGAG